MSSGAVLFIDDPSLIRVVVESKDIDLIEYLAISNQNVEMIKFLSVRGAHLDREPNPEIFNTISSVIEPRGVETLRLLNHPQMKKYLLSLRELIGIKVMNSNDIIDAGIDDWS